MFCVALSLLSAPTQVRFANVLDTVSFVCEVGGVPLPHVNWVMSEQRIPVSNDRASVATSIINSNTIMSTLTIRSIQLNDAGLYICNAINGEVSEQAIYNVTTGTYVCILE